MRAATPGAVRVRAVSFAALAAMTLLAGCGDDGNGGDDLPSASPPAPTTTTPAVTPTSSVPSPSPSTTAALSRFESDPAVQGLRAYLVASSRALNARNPRLPALLATSTARQQALNLQVLGRNAGGYDPGPQPMTPVAVASISSSERRVRACFLETGWTLSEKGGAPLRARKVSGAAVTMKLQGGVWKADRLVADEGVSCRGVRLVEQRFS